MPEQVDQIVYEYKGRKENGEWAFRIPARDLTVGDMLALESQGITPKDIEKTGFYKKARKIKKPKNGKEA